MMVHILKEFSLCDNIPDCNDGEDKMFCKCPNTVDVFQTKCKYVCDILEKACSCSDLYFNCKNSHKCIHYSKICDGTIDCPGGNDEFCNHVTLKKHFSFHTYKLFKSITGL